MVVDGDAGFEVGDVGGVEGRGRSFARDDEVGV